MEYGGGRPVLIRHFHNHSDYNEHPLRKIYGNIFYRSATMIGCSESVTNSIKRDFPKIDVRCVNNAISFSRLDEYEVIGLDQGISVMMFGADFERKGVDITYKAINDLVNKGYQINLYIVCSINEDIVASTLEGDPIVKYSWYSAAIIIVYVFFEISKMNSSRKCNLYVMTLLLVGYIMFGVFRNYSVYWYNAVLIVLVGILVARYKEQIYCWIKHYDKTSVIVSLIALGAGTVLQIKYGNSVGEVAKVLIQQVTLIAAVYLMMMVDYFFSLNSIFLKWVAAFSYEIYLTHGFVMSVVKHFLAVDTAGIAYAGTVIAITILLSFAEHLLNKKVIRALNRLILAQ